MHENLVNKYITVQTAMLAPIVPNYTSKVCKITGTKHDFPTNITFNQVIINKASFWNTVWGDIHNQITYAHKKDIQMKYIMVDFVRNAPDWYREASKIMKSNRTDNIKEMSKFISKQKISKKTKKRIIGMIAKSGCLDMSSYKFTDEEIDEMMSLMNNNIDIDIKFNITNNKDGMMPNKAKITMIK